MTSTPTTFGVIGVKAWVYRGDVAPGANRVPVPQACSAWARLPTKEAQATGEVPRSSSSESPTPAERPGADADARDDESEEEDRVLGKRVKKGSDDSDQSGTEDVADDTSEDADDTTDVPGVADGSRRRAASTPPPASRSRRTAAAPVLQQAWHSSQCGAATRRPGFASGADRRSRRATSKPRPIWPAMLASSSRSSITPSVL